MQCGKFFYFRSWDTKMRSKFKSCRFKKPRNREMNARGYAIHSVCSQIFFFVWICNSIKWYKMDVCEIATYQNFRLLLMWPRNRIKPQNFELKNKNRLLIIWTSNYIEWYWTIVCTIARYKFLDFQSGDIQMSSTSKNAIRIIWCIIFSYKIQMRFSDEN